MHALIRSDSVIVDDHSFKYAAFISYSHAADDKLAPALQSALHRFAKPWYRMPVIRVFRDKTSLSANPALWPSIEKALGESEHFLLLASPDAARSPWVQREIEWWLTNRPAEKLLIVLTDGDLVWDDANGDFDWTKTTALAGNLRSRFEAEPLYVNLQWAKTADTLSLEDSTFREAILDLAAPLRGIPKDDLDSEDIRQHRNFRAFRNAAVLAILGFAIVAAWQWYEATQQRNEAQLQEKIAVARQLAAQAELLRTQQPDSLPRSVLLAIESMQRLGGLFLPSPEAHHALHDGVALLPYQITAVKHSDSVRAVAFSSDGKYLATGSSDGTAVVWDAVTGRELMRLPHGNSVLGVAFSPDGKYLGTASLDQTARVWEVANGHEIVRLAHRMVRGDSVTTVAFSPDGKYLATGAFDFTARVWEISTGREIFRTAHDEAVNSVAYSPDGRHLVAGSGNSAGKQRPEIAKGSATVWDITSKRQVTRVDLDGTVQGVAFAPDGKSFATASWDHTARIWDASTGREIMRVSHPTGYVEAVSFSPDGKYLATGSNDNTARVWNVETRREVCRVTHGKFVNAVAFSPDGHYLATASLDRSARIWEPGTRREITQTPATEFDLDAASGSLAAILLNNLKGEGDNLGWESISGRQADNVSGMQDTAMRSGRIVTSQDGSYMAMVGGTNAPAIFAKPDMQEIARLLHQAPVNDIAFSPDGSLVATASSDRTARVWQLPAGREVARMPHDARVIGVTFSSDGKYLATGSEDRTARVWEVATGREVVRMSHEKEVEAVAFSPDTQYLATTSGGHLARVWRWKTSPAQPYVVAQFAHDAIVGAVSFSPAGRYLLTISGDPLSFVEPAARLWLWRPADMTAEACARLPRNLTSEEWGQYITSEHPRKTCPKLPGP